MKLIIFCHFDINPRFPPYLLYVRCKFGETFVQRCFCDENALQLNLTSLYSIYNSRQSAIPILRLFEPRCEKTGFVVSDKVRHKPGCTATEDG